MNPIAERVMLGTVSAVGWVTVWAATGVGEAVTGTVVGVGAAVALIWRLVTDHRITDERDAINDHWRAIAQEANERARRAETDREEPSP